MTFGSTLRLLRKSENIGIRELSNKLHYHRSYLSRVENDAVHPSDEFIKAAAKFFKMAEDELRISAGKFPEDVVDILSHHPEECVSVLRDSLGDYYANGGLFSTSNMAQLPDEHASKALNGTYLDHVVQGDCLEVLKRLPSSCVDLVVTSPPYADNRRKTYEGVPPDKYVDWFLPMTGQLKRVLRPKGSFVLNIKERVVDGERHTYVIELILKMRAQGWKWVEEYIWHKKNCYPGYWPNRFRDAWERCLHFTTQKNLKMFQEAVMVPMGDWRVSRLKNLSETDRKRDDSKVLSGFGKRIANWVGREKAYPTNVLHMATECANKGHSATFPVALPEWFIKLFTRPGDVVLDPFIGSGTTAVACLRSNRHFVGIELNPAFCKLAEQRLAEEQKRLGNVPLQAGRKDKTGIRTSGTLVPIG